jgi:predicted kinase
MDLYRNGRADLAEWFLARFAYECDDYDGFALFDGYASYRALVRAKVAAMLAADPSTKAMVVERKRSEARATLTLAQQLLAVRRPAPVAWAVGGLIGAGKTTVAEALARRTGAVPVSADATRKSLAGLRHEQHALAEHYTDEFTGRVQTEVLRRAESVLRSGRGVILDSTFRSARLRHAALALASRCHARFHLVECTAPAEVLRQRLRERTRSVSDAREDLLERCVAEYEPVRELLPEQHLVVDTTRPLDRLVDEILRAGA